MFAYPTDAEARAQLLEFGRRMYEQGFVAANDGNLSCRVAGDAVWATPTGVSKGYMKEETLVKLSLGGEVLYQEAREPSSEIRMHLRAYRENPMIGGVVHAHPPAATAFAIAGEGLDKPVYPEAMVLLGTVPCTPFATPGTQDVAESIAPYCRGNGYTALLLGNHGALAWGATLEQAWFRLEALEHYADILQRLGLGPKAPSYLTAKQMEAVGRIRASFGLSPDTLPKA